MPDTNKISFKQRAHETPAANTAALRDLIQAMAEQIDILTSQSEVIHAPPTEEEIIETPPEE